MGRNAHGAAGPAIPMITILTTPWGIKSMENHRLIQAANKPKGQSNTEPANHPQTALRTVICILATVGNIIISIVHVITIALTSNLLDGHKYGSPDKYGDYARGLYKGEAAELSSNTEKLWLLLLGIIAFGIIALVTRPKTAEGTSDPVGKFALYCAYTAVAFTAFCLVGTLYVTLVGGMYR